MRCHQILCLFSMILFAACGGKENEIEVQSIALSQPSAEMEVGETLTLKATVSPSNATYDGITWTSTNPKVASVTTSGLVSAMSEGNTTITVMAGGKTASCSVTVVKGFVAVTFINLDNTSLEMVEGDTETLTASIQPDDATDKTVTWTSSNEEVATVNDGVVSAVSAGEATITAKAGDQTALCKVTVQKKFVAVESVELNKMELTLVEGNTETLTATVKPDDATDKAVSWKSSDDKIATVDANGKVTAIKVGEATITATAGEKSVACKVVVQKKPVPVSGISLDQSSIEIHEGETKTLTATVLPNDATDKTVTWKSSKPSVATVEDGVITALAVGETTISASAGDKTATCKVTVKQRIVASNLTLSKSTFNGSISSNCTVSLTLTPANAQYDLEWTSSNPRVAEVQGNGLSAKIQTKDFGTAIITVTDKISGKSVSMTVQTNVMDFQWQESTGSSYSGYPLITIDEGEEYQLHFSYSPSSATHLFEDLSNFVFYEHNTTVSSPSVITIDPDGKIKGVKAGTVGIKPTGLIKGTTGRDRVYITVQGETIPVTEVQLNKTSLTLNVGKAEALTATILPKNATNQTVTWISSNTSVATVNANGTVKAVAGGSATITAKVDGVSAKCYVTVTASVTSVSLNKTSLTLAKGNSETLIATVYPTDASNKAVTWKSSNTSVATVTSSGKVTAVAAGTAQITVTTKDGSKKATCTVTVTDKPQDSQFSIDSWRLNTDYTLGDQDQLNPEDPKAYYDRPASPYNKDNKGWGAVYGRSSDPYQELPFRSGLTEHFMEYMYNFKVNSASIYRFEIKNYTINDVDWEVVFGNYGVKTYNDGTYHAYVELTGTELTEIIQEPALVPYLYLTTDDILTRGYDVLIEVTETNTELNTSKYGYYFVVFKGLDCMLKLYDVKLGTFGDVNDFVYTHELVEGIYDAYGDKLFEWKNGGWVATTAAKTYGITDTDKLTVEVKSVLMYPWDTEESFGGNLYSFEEGSYLYPTPTKDPTDSGINWWNYGLNLQVDKKAMFTVQVLWGDYWDDWDDYREVLCEADGTVMVLASANSIHPLHNSNGSLYSPVTYTGGWFYAK